MKAKLLKKLRVTGREQITIYSVTKSISLRGEYITGMSYGYSDSDYKGLFDFGDSENDVRDKAMRIYFRKNMDSIRHKYRKYSRKYKLKL